MLYFEQNLLSLLLTCLPTTVLYHAYSIDCKAELPTVFAHSFCPQFFAVKLWKVYRVAAFSGHAGLKLRTSPKFNLND